MHTVRKCLFDKTYTCRAAFAVFLLRFCFPDWLPEAVSPSNKQTMSVSLLEISTVVTGELAPNVCKMQELSAKTKYPFQGVTMPEEFDHTT